MWEMLVIAFLVAVIEKTGFLLTEDIEDIIYVKESGEESTVKPKKKKAKGETEKNTEEKKQSKKVEESEKPKPKAKPKPKPKTTDSVLEENFEDVLQPNITAVTNDRSEDFQSEVLSGPSLSLEYDSLADFASELLKEVKEG